MPGFDKSLNEHFDEQNRELGGRVEASKKRIEELKEKQVMSKMSPLHWLERRWARRSYDFNKQAYDRMLESVKEYGAEIQEEANNYAAARGEYESTQQRLAQVVGVEPTMVDMNQFIKEMERIRYYLPAAIPAGASQEERERITTEAYKQSGEILAAMDLFTPALPVGDKPGGFKGSTIEMGGSTYRTGWGGERVPRLEVGKDRSSALSEAKEKGAKYVFVLSSGIEHRYGGEVDRQAKYIVLDDETAEFLKANERFLSGATPLYFPDEMSPMSRRAPPWMTIDFNGEVVPVEDLEKQEKQGEEISITLKFEVEDFRSSRGDSRRVELKGSLDELRREVGRRVFREEWAPGSEQNVVHKAVVEIDGREVPWEEFISRSS